MLLYPKIKSSSSKSVGNAGKIGAALTRNGETSSLDPDASSRLCRPFAGFDSVIQVHGVPS